MDLPPMSNTPAHFADRLFAAMDAKGSPVCVGIDPVFDRLPEKLQGDDPLIGIDAWMAQVIWAVEPHVPAVKFQSACFERYGWPGMACMQQGIEQAREAGLITILDAKRGDIGISARHYAAAAFDVQHADALTVNAYLGPDTLEPVIEHAVNVGAGLFVLARTSNPGSDAFQNQPLADGRTVGQSMADLVAQAGAPHVGECGYSHVGAVVGATKPAEMAELRQRMRQQIFLVPGYGAQGGSADDVKAAFDDQGRGALITASRSVIYAYQGTDASDFAEPIRDAAAALASDIQRILQS
jgi:orotidine-5'-phosphate decarboxylase